MPCRMSPDEVYRGTVPQNRILKERRSFYDWLVFVSCWSKFTTWGINFPTLPDCIFWPLGQPRGRPDLILCLIGFHLGSRVFGEPDSPTLWSIMRLWLELECHESNCCETNREGFRGQEGPRGHWGS